MPCTCVYVHAYTQAGAVWVDTKFDTLNLRVQQACYSLSSHSMQSTQQAINATSNQRNKQSTQQAINATSNQRNKQPTQQATNATSNQRNKQPTQQAINATSNQRNKQPTQQAINATSNQSTKYNLNQKNVFQTVKRLLLRAKMTAGGTARRTRRAAHRDGCVSMHEHQRHGHAHDVAAAHHDGVLAPTQRPVFNVRLSAHVYACVQCVCSKREDTWIRACVSASRRACVCSALYAFLREFGHAASRCHMDTTTDSTRR